ncbi:Scp-like extracellular protein [Globisporangium polare]
MLQAVNAERVKQGKAAFCTNKKLQTAAQLHSEDQAKTNTMSHTGSDGSTMDQRVTAQGFVWSGVAENVAAGQVDVASVMTSWMNSAGHRANILGDYNYFGTGYAYNAQGTYKHFWTQDFGSGSNEACDDGASASTPAPATKAPVTQTPVYTSPPATKAPVTTAPPATKAPVAQTQAPATSSPVYTSKPTTAPPATTTAPVTTAPPATSSPVYTSKPVVTRTPRSSRPSATKKTECKPIY